MWNRIPISIREVDELNDFKTKLCKYLWTQIDCCDHVDDDDDVGYGIGQGSSTIICLGYQAVYIIVCIYMIEIPVYVYYIIS